MSVVKSYSILDRIRLPHGLYLASPSVHYSYVWIRDSIYISLPYLNKPNDIYARTYHRLLDLMMDYEWKIDIHIKERPRETWQYIHSKYSATDVKELYEPWGHAQHDAIGALLWGIGEGEKNGKAILRNDKDRQIVQKLVDYLASCEYWHDEDNGMWEEGRAIHASSLGACIGGLQNVKYLVNVPPELIIQGQRALAALKLMEMADRDADLSQLSLVYPYRVYASADARKVVEKVEAQLLRKRGVIRYKGDSYYSTKEQDGRHHALSYYDGTEAEWCFGLPWLALCHMEFGNYDVAADYIELTEAVMLEDGSLPELYFADSEVYNPNTPLGWSNAMYILAKERMEQIMSVKH